MKAKDILFEFKSDLEDALSSGWVRIRYTRKDGMSRILMVTTNPELYHYDFRTSEGHRRRWHPLIILVWEHKVGWRALYRTRIGGWKRA